MNELRNARKEELSLQYHQLSAQAKKEVFEAWISLSGISWPRRALN